MVIATAVGTSAYLEWFGCAEYFYRLRIYKKVCARCHEFGEPSTNLVDLN